MIKSNAFSDTVLQSLLANLEGNGEFVFFESIRVTPENHLSYLFSEPVERLVCGYSDDPVVFFSRAREKLEQGFFLAGYVAYEFGYLLEPVLARSFRQRPPAADKPSRPLPLADLGVFRKPLVYDHLTSSLQGDGSWPAAGPPASGSNFTVDKLRLNLGREEYLEAISRIKSYIEAGDTYQVNYTLKLLFEFSGSVPEFYCSLRRNQSVSYGGMIKNGDMTILTFSPELFFRKTGDTITVRPMKGTMHRGRTVAEDREFSGLLHRDIKNRSENVMIVDLLRNDLGRLSRMGGVDVRSLFDVETYETLHQMTSSIRGEVDRSVSLEEMFKALFPCGSVTGAPKIRTMEIIRELEADDRGVYTGAIGYIGPDTNAVFNVPIRTVVLQGNRGEMGIGSGIVWDSDPVAEWEECKLKGRFLSSPAPEFSLIETMLWQPGSGYWLLDLHLARLAESAGYFFYPLDVEKIKAGLDELAESFCRDASATKMHRVRLTLSRQGEVGLTHTELPEGPFPVTDPAVILQQKESMELPEVIFSEKHTDSHSPYLFHKTTLRKLYDDERARAAAGGYYEVLFVNEKGEVTEGSFTSIFIRNGDTFITPPVSCGLLPGILRSHLLQEFPDSFREGPFSRQEAKQADAVYVGNSVRGLVQVTIEN